MTFVTPVLLAGTALVVLPLVLHLIMQRKPRHIEFPALRFVQKRHDTNQRRLRLRHLLLLALRMALIALLALGLARPSIRTAGALGSSEAPVAAALVIDTSKRMEYRHENRTRMEVAKKMALELLARLPRGSQVAVLSTRYEPAAFQVDTGAAKYRLERLETAANSQSLTDVLTEAVRLVTQSELARREIYVFTDLARAAWPKEPAERLQRHLAKAPEVGLFLIDVGVEKPTNSALGELRLSSQVLTNRSALRIDTDLFHNGPATTRSVEVYLLDAQKKPQKSGEQTVKLDADGSQHLEFQLGALELGTHQGYVTIVGQDGLACDDRRYFTVEVHPAWKILLVAPQPADRYSVFLREALAPATFRRSGQARFDCAVIAQDKLATQKLDGYSAVCLVDPRPLEPPVWQKLGDFAAEGRAVAIFLGRNAQPLTAFNVPAALDLLPGKLVRQVRRPDGAYLAPGDFQHPVLRAFGDYAGSIPWDAFPVFRYWQFDKLAAGVHVIVPLTDDGPVLLERPLGKGRVLTLATPVSDRPDQEAWNLLPVGDAWPFVILANEMASYLVGSSQQQLNYYAGQTAVLHLESDKDFHSYVLTVLDAPDSVEVRLTPDLKQRVVLVTSTNREGNYRVQAGGSDAGVDRGFSVNVSREQTELERLDPKEFQALFGPSAYRLARDSNQLEGNVTEGRVGRDLYPFVILAVAVALALEHLMANRFYKE
jgi:hypothetical protein